MFKTQVRTRNRTRDLPKKGSAFILSSDHWTYVVQLGPPVLRSGCVGWEDLVVILLGVGDDGESLMCWRRARLLC